MAYNTGNAVPSRDPRDLVDNSEDLDEAINSSELTFHDRLGRPRLTLRGYEDAAGSGDVSIQAAAQAVDAAWRAEIAAENVVSNAEAIANQAAAQAVANVQIAVDGAVDEAQAAQAAAEAARDAAQLSAGVYPDTTAGLAATVAGQYFSVPSADDEEYLILYNNSTGAAVEVRRYPSIQAIESRIGTVDVLPRRVPLVVDEGGKVPVWLDDGALDAAGVGPGIRRGVGLPSVELDDSARVPVLMDENEQVAIWLDGGKLDAKGFGRALGAEVSGIAREAVENMPANLASLLTTDGKTLWLSKARRALLNNAANAKLKIMFIGDSWSDLNTIPVKMSELLERHYQRAGYGWLSMRFVNMLYGVTATRSGWTLYTSPSPLVHEYGCALDGTAMMTETVTATAQIAGLQATDITIYYRGGDGTLRYRIDGGEWMTAPAGTTGQLERAAITGLSDAAHTVELDTIGNTGTVVVYGIYATRDVSGYEILKCGLGGMTGANAQNFIPYISEYAADFQADLLIISLGTNDYRSGGLSGYIDGLAGFIDAHRAGNPDIGVIVIAPPDSNGIPVIPLTTIREYGQRISADLGCEFADIHAIFPGFAKANAVGLWDDDLHLNANGADILCRHIYKHLID